MARDESYLREDSPLWRTHRERLVRLAAPRALLLQAGHPLVWAGLLDSGRALGEAHHRLNRTAAALGTAAFGSREDADRVGRRVQRIHRHVRGALERDAGRFPAGTPYAADDPALLLWVLAAIADSALAVHELCVRRQSRDERDALWQDYRVLGRVFGLRTQDTPDTIEGFDAYMAGMVAGGDLHVGAEVRTIVTDAVLWPRLGARMQPALALIRLVTVGSLPPPLRDWYGLSWGPARSGLLGAGAWCTRRAVVPLLPRRVRHVGVRSGPNTLAETRPVLVGHVRRDDDAVVVVSGGTELRVEGEPELARQVLALCDGELSLAEIVDQLDDREASDDVYELMERLVEYGALRDRAAR